MSESLSPKYFEDVYAASADPWNFETSGYENAKYMDTLGALPGHQYGNAFEIGCSIGVLTQRLAERCEHLLAADVSERALSIARRRCRNLPQVVFQRMHIPLEYPQTFFDLTVLSEVGYYWDRKDLARAASLICGHMTAGGHLLLVHWTPAVPDYPLTGDQVHEFFLTHPALVRVHGHASTSYRLDLLTTRTPAPLPTTA